jgi:hypothetical protein
MGKKSDLSPECQKFVKKLFAFFSKEKATKKPIVSFDRVYQKTSKALGVSYTSVHRIMNGQRPCKSNRPKERANILDDFNYLRKIKSFREAGYDIVHMDETWVNQNHCTDHMWLPNDGSDSPKIPSGKGKRLIVLHAGMRSEGLIDGCDLVFLAKSKDGDCHQEMNSVVFLEGFENPLMSALKNPSLVVLDNASYHNVKTEYTVCPNFSKKKAVLQNYLTLHNIAFSATDTKKVL